MITHNDFTPLNLWSVSPYQVLDVFSKCSGEKHVSLLWSSPVTYVFVVNDANVDVVLDVSWVSSHIDVFWIFFWSVSSRITSSLSVNNSFVRVHLYTLVQDNVDISVDGNIVLEKNIIWSQWHLTQEQFLLGVPKSLRVCPILDVYSSAIKASHAAKIHTLDAQKLFYMMAKWLSLQHAQKMVIEASLQSIFDRLSSLDDEKKGSIFTYITSSLFTSFSFSW